jgi:acyl carrier protein
MSIDQPLSDSIAMVHSAIAEVAPELEPELADLDPDVDFWLELQLDSMDHLSIMTRLSEQIGRDIPERDYPRLTTVNTLCAYLVGPDT